MRRPGPLAGTWTPRVALSPLPAIALKQLPRLDQFFKRPPQGIFSIFEMAQRPTTLLPRGVGLVGGEKWCYKILTCSDRKQSANSCSPGNAYKFPDSCGTFDKIITLQSWSKLFPLLIMLSPNFFGEQDIRQFWCNIK